jgi:hypothetical protein
LTVNGFLKTGINPTLNDDCSIKSREAFLKYLKIKKNKDKTVIMALHHPLMTNGSHGQFSLKNRFSH